jgi:hypothetical protein
VLGFFLTAQPHMQAVGLMVIVAAGLLFLIYLAVSAAMHTVFMTAVYQFASSERVPEGFDREKLSHAFVSR